MRHSGNLPSVYREYALPTTTTSRAGGGREGGREIYIQSGLLKRTVLVARAQTALYLAAGLFPLSLKDWR
jgi:hypothetical protein